MVKCSKCGSMVADGSKFCTECGNEMQMPLPAGEVKFPAPPVMKTSQGDDGAVIFPGPDMKSVVSEDTGIMKDDCSMNGTQDNLRQAAQESFQPEAQAVYANPAVDFGLQQANTMAEPVREMRTLTREERKQLRPSGGKRFLAFMLRLLAGMLVGILILLLTARCMISKSAIKSLYNRAMDGREEIYKEFTKALDRELRRNGAGRFEELERIDNIDDFIAEILSDTAKSVLTGKGDIIDVDAVVEWVETNKRAIEKYTDQDISKNDIHELRDELEEYNEDIADKLEDMDSYEKTILNVLRFIFGTTNLVILICMIVLLYGLNYLIYGRYYDQCTVKIGIMTLVHSAIAVFAALGIIILGVIAVSVLGAPDDISVDMIFNFIGTRYLLVSGAFMAGSILLIVIGKLLRKGNKAYKIA